MVLVNHFKSKGYSEPGDRLGNRRRHRQATRVAEIYAELRDGGAERSRWSATSTTRRTASRWRRCCRTPICATSAPTPAFDFGPRRGTFRGSNEPGKLDYVLLSPSLWERVTGGAVFRKGVWHGPRTENPWELYPTLTAEVHAASDHAVIYADIDLE